MHKLNLIPSNSGEFNFKLETYYNLCYNQYIKFYGVNYYQQKGKCDMEQFVLVRPTNEYASQIAEYRQEFLDADDSMDGTGPLRRIYKSM